ncbi:hypothetical protein KCU65_g362, partial [Aureobasidium melanogenum]
MAVGKLSEDAKTTVEPGPTSPRDEAKNSLHRKSKCHGLAATNFVREIATDEWTWDVEAVDHNTPAKVSDERVTGINFVRDGAREDTKGLGMWSVWIMRIEITTKLTIAIQLYKNHVDEAPSKGRQ